MIVLTAVFSCVCVLSHPAKPLNERSTELAFEAWLLVDQSNRQSDLGGLLRRRITPKSVFIAPTFSPESLPPCAEGYKSDSMGRCVKFVKINTTAHFNFILDRLNAQFAEEATTERATQGPLHLNIPFPGEPEENKTSVPFFDLEDATEMAIVVTPLGNHLRHDHPSNTAVKVDMKRDGEVVDAKKVAAILRVDPEDVQTTTLEELSTTLMATTWNDETTTEMTTEVASTTTETSETTTLLEGDAIFFQI